MEERLQATGLPAKLINDTRRSDVRNFERRAVPRSVATTIVSHNEESLSIGPSLTKAMQQDAAARLDVWARSPLRLDLSGR